MKNFITIAMLIIFFYGLFVIRKCMLDSDRPFEICELTCIKKGWALISLEKGMFEVRCHCGTPNQDVIILNP